MLCMLPFGDLLTSSRCVWSILTVALWFLSPQEAHCTTPAQYTKHCLSILCIIWASCQRFSLTFEHHCCRSQVVLGCVDRPMAQPLLLRRWPVHPGWRIYQGTTEKTVPFGLGYRKFWAWYTYTSKAHVCSSLSASSVVCTTTLMEFLCSNQPMYALNHIRRHYLSKPCREDKALYGLVVKQDCAPVV